MDKKGRPAPEKAKRSEKRIAADVVVVAIGQGVETHGFEQTKIAIKRGAFVTEASGQIDNMDGVFAGGDCVTGPATVIRAIAAGKVAAASADGRGETGKGTANFFFVIGIIETGARFTLVFSLLLLQ